MSNSEFSYPAAGGSGSNSTPVSISQPYSSSLPNPPGDIGSARHTRCATGISFIKTINGILNIIIIIAIVCVIISAGVVDPQTTRDADSSIYGSSARVSAFHTRNAVLVFAVFGLFFILVDTILHMTRLINRLPALFDVAFIILMFILAGIYLILGCCAAAWEQKMRDALEPIPESYKKGAAASASFWIFIAMIAIIVNFVLRLISKPSQSFNPSAIINRSAYHGQVDVDGAARF